MLGSKASSESSASSENTIFQHSADWCLSLASAAAKRGSGVPQHSPRAGKFPFPGHSKPNSISTRSLHQICHRAAGASSRFAKAAKQAWKHTLSHRRCLLCAHRNGASRVKREEQRLHLRWELPQPCSPAGILPPPSLQTGRASNSSPKMLQVDPLKENFPKPCLPPQSTICAGCWQPRGEWHGSCSRAIRRVHHRLQDPPSAQEQRHGMRGRQVYLNGGFLALFVTDALIQI